ncbi:MAG: hypothetical protein AB7O97_14570 [Planctomycetota bacterium]
MPLRSPRAREACALLLLFLLPAFLLGDSLFTARSYQPFDLAEFPPTATTMAPEQLEALRVGANYDATEPPVLFAPDLRYARAALADGRFPHWTPYVRHGVPFAAHGLMGFLNPLHWPALLCADPDDGLLYLTYCMLALGGALMYGLLRALRLSLPAALFGAVAFAWSGTMTANAHWYMRLEPLALLPGMLWALLALARARGSARALPTLGLAAAVWLAWSASFPPFAIAGTAVSGVAALLLAAHTGRAEGAMAALRYLGWALLAVVLGLMLAAPTIAPQLLFFPVSNRPLAPTLAAAGELAFDPMGLLGLVLPDAFAHPGDRSMPGGSSPLAYLLFSRTDWESGAMQLPDGNYNFTEYALFPGTLPLLLAALGLLARGPRWRLWCGGALVLLVLLAMGAGPLRFAYLLPGIQSVPPYRFVGLLCVGITALAALGAERLWRGDAARAARVTALIAAVGGATCLFQGARLGDDGVEVEARWLHEITERYRPLAQQFDPNLRPEFVTEDLVRQHLFTGRDDRGQPVDRLRAARLRLSDNLHRGGLLLCMGAAFLLLASLWRGNLPVGLAALALLATAAELWTFGQPLNRGRVLYEPAATPVLDFLRARRDEDRARGGFAVARANPGGGHGWHLPPGPLMHERIRDLHFYTLVDKYSTGPFRAVYGDDFLVRGFVPQSLPDDERLRLPWWDAIGLRYLVSTAPMKFAGVRTGPELRGPGGEFFVYERPGALPRAWVVPTLRAAGDEAAMLQEAVAPDFAPRDYALVTDAVAHDLPPLPGLAAARDREVTFVHEDEKRLTLRVGPGPSGYLVVADTMMPGWTATIDGVPAQMVRGNVLMRVVPVPAGACEMAMRYRTPGLLGGLWLGAAGAVAAAALLVLHRRGRRGDVTPPPPAT